MRRIVAVAAALLSACAVNPSAAPAEPVAGEPPQPIPVHGVTPGHKCDAAGADRFLGQTATSATGTAILRASNAAVLRWAPPNTMLTMDYREDRVTIWLDAASKITKIRCG
jgi:type IV pilus biogenesis protein CpaD/CtpE